MSFNFKLLLSKMGLKLSIKMMKIHLKDKTQSLVLRQTQHYLLDKQI